MSKPSPALCGPDRRPDEAPRCPLLRWPGRAMKCKHRGCPRDTVDKGYCHFHTWTTGPNRKDPEMTQIIRPLVGMLVRVHPEDCGKFYPAIITGVHSKDTLDLVAFHHEDFKTHGPNPCTQPYPDVQHKAAISENDLHLSPTGTGSSWATGSRRRDEGG